ncbi:MAG: response regulator transcription factor [Terracidiphilus sp.]
MTVKGSSPQPIRIGVPAGEPVRVAGLASIFDLPAQEDQAQLVPVIGTLPELLALEDIDYFVVDLHSSSGGLEELQTIRRARPEIRSIVIGPEGDDELVLNAIIAGARAYLGQSAGPGLVRLAIGVVTSGSIWAPRRLLCRVIDRLLKTPSTRQASGSSQLTPREQQVLELITMAHSTREIASRLGIEQRTVKAYVGRLMRKTGVDNRVKLSMSALNRPLLQSDSARGAGLVVMREKVTD